ncbi:hypothetical protein TYRP_020294 [Tyrophagus putrescentiae]|nr:hypothetical protein TYRP_020294 [Tyrophagus putrescentiae]
MSPRSAGLVRAANRRVKTLVIDRQLFNFATFKWKSGIPAHSLALSPSVQLLLLPSAADERPNYHFPKGHLPNTTTTARLTRRNYLLVEEEDQLFDQATIELIVTAVFSAITELVFIWQSSALGENLLALLRRPQWARQLTSLEVCHLDNLGGSPNEDHSNPYGEPLSRRLAAAINELPALQCLSMSSYDNFPLLPPDLCRMTQLQVLAIYAWEDSGDSPTAEASLRSLERYAADNVNNEEEDHHHHHRLQVHLSGWLPTERLHSLSPALRRRIVRFDLSELSWADFDVPRLCRHFPSLNTLSVSVEAAPRPIRALFAALSSLPQLVHLALDMTRERPRTLDLELRITSSKLPLWLNLPVVMPQLQALHLEQFYCVRRAIDLCNFLEQKANSSSSYSTNLKYFRSTLPLLHPGVPHEQFILGRSEPYPTLQQLLSASWW